MYKIRLAPMCGITDFIYRTICEELGCEMGYTEMISAMGYLCAPNQQATRELMIRGVSEKKLVLQLFGRDPDTVAEAAQRIEALGIYDGIDLNMGCPARKVASSGEGSGLLRTPFIARSMMEKTVRSVSIPVSVKIRLGWDAEHICAVEYAKMAEDSGISEITVHGRTKEQQYSGEADWEAISQVKQAVNIPVIGNGDIFTPEDGIKRLRESGADGIMVGRGVMGNPWIFRGIQQLMNGKQIQPVTLKERYEMIRKHSEAMQSHLPVHIALREMRKHIGWYIHGLRGAAAVRAKINRCEDPDEAERILESFFCGLNA